ncbi:hypothetical protein GCM10027268_11350 [Brachybacterium huguangmaarense]
MRRLEHELDAVRAVLQEREEVDVAPHEPRARSGGSFGCDPGRAHPERIDQRLRILRAERALVPGLVHSPLPLPPPRAGTVGHPAGYREEALIR